MTSFSDLESSRVIYGGESRRKEVLEKFGGDRKELGKDSEQIDLVCLDMWDP